MKHLCCSRYFLLLLFLSSALWANLSDKSAIIYYGKNISYSMVGIHDYIIVNPSNVNTKAHGFSVYKKKIYARIVVDKKKNDSLKNLQKTAALRVNQGFENFFFDIRDAKEREKELISFINKFHEKYPDYKLIIKSKLNMEQVYDSVTAVLFESHLKAKYSDKEIEKIKSYGLDIIDVEYAKISDMDEVSNIVNKIKANGMIPYVTNFELNIYGKSSKKAVKREILTLIDESVDDRILISAHQHGALSLEYMGYIQKLHDINRGLPDIDSMGHYAGVVVWLSVDYEHPAKLIRWVLSLDKLGIKVAFADNFGSEIDSLLLKQLGIDIYDGVKSAENKKTIIYKDDMIGFEIEPSLSDESLYLHPSNSKALLTYEDKNGLRSTPSAITPWGGYAISESFMLELNDENIWIIDPFKFFAETLRLKKLVVPDPTTENGNRLLFTHIDGDGIMNYVESNPELFSGDMILEKILKPYKIPHSVSLIGAEIMNHGLYPEISEKLIAISKKMYALENVEGATHTFTHPFIWGKIKNGELDKEYRLKVKNYDFSLDYEIKGQLDYINKNILKSSKQRANTVFWSGDCAPPERVLENIYSYNILNINGGDTIISNSNPWLALVAPLGLERGDYYQIYTGAQNENVFTNDWLGPFWGFKRVVQTFKLTNSPRRFKPIDVYYHLYSGSKTASLNALKYIFDWAVKQDVMPIFTSEYIPKAMDYFTVSMAQEGNEWLVEGMRDLKTLRIEEEGASVDFKKSKSALGIKHFENHTYISLDNSAKHFITTSQDEAYKDRTYLISSNAKVVDYRNGINNQRLTFDGHVDLKLNFHLSKSCKLSSIPEPSKIVENNASVFLDYLDVKKASVNIICK
ncbi:MAG: hypothetical protein U9O83_02690 [Campylobacterota bacterium]|nr:hypothetical protein [Campylobacterota bacterium]